MPIRKIELNGNLTWIDVTNYEKVPLEELILEYKVPQHLMADSIYVGHLPKFEETNPNKLIIARYIQGFKIDELASIQEFSNKIAFIFQDNLLITIHRLEIDFISNMDNSFLDSKKIRTINDIIEHILYKILKTYELPNQEIGTKIDVLEEKLFLKQTNNSLSKELYILKRESSAMRKLLTLTGDALKSLEKSGFKSKDYFGIKDLHIKLIAQIEQNIEDVSNLLNLFFAISSQKTNDIVKTLTILSIFFMPLTFIAGVYGMNFEFMPELKWKYGYYFSLVLMLMVSIIILKIFKMKKWF